MSFDSKQFSSLQNIIQKKLSEFQNHQKTQVFEGSALGGKVSVKLSLSNIINYQVQEVKLDPSLLSEKSILIEDLIKAALNDAFKKSSDYNTNLMSSLMSFNM
ncbi:YbaB/EbfC family nucleoid-associated protein [Candidatus Neoehrlichia procyonis]|uniref:YbaB/EbfC DNA-binding family protein n=1 Tax=Candidatus Neoehrlichia procyonis str. RAC413 TaxID=1359163 RepID=A0A0F3NMW2_9RICK|nr:YbaB/EbfC family nucleoid-associated protein [Candidatus Neoehrlichia lotoris]KJV69395.1 ybaB/EbfC DNA-binding family protein [Candidatus Neoehrlichia lotoris str. RAC413]